jgi:hypothetical protein
MCILFSKEKVHTPSEKTTPVNSPMKMLSPSVGSSEKYRETYTFMARTSLLGLNRAASAFVAGMEILIAGISLRGPMLCPERSMDSAVYVFPEITAFSGADVYL